MNDPIEEALQSYPLTNVPRGFSKGVLQKIRTINSPIKFQLTWLDYALVLFFSTLPVIWFFIQASIPRLWITDLEYQWQLMRSPVFEPALLATLGVFSLFSLVTLIAVFRFIVRPQNFSLQ